MTDKELKRLSRAELLEMLLAQTEDNERLKTELAQAQKALDDRRILIDECGTMAEAALKLNGVFDAVDKAVRQYLEKDSVQCARFRGKSTADNGVGPSAVAGSSAKYWVCSEYGQFHDQCAEYLSYLHRVLRQTCPTSP